MDILHPTPEVRAYCRTCIENLEIWPARRIIHNQFINIYGTDYFTSNRKNGEPVFNKAVKEHIEFIKQQEPERFPTVVDAMFLEDIIAILCKKNDYHQLFRPFLESAYPLGNEELRVFLIRLLPIRNALSHSNPISRRQAEQAICYSNDFIDAIKEQYAKMGEDRKWNVPTIISIHDSLGNILQPLPHSIVHVISQDLYVGDTYSVSIEIDPSFNISDYTIKWSNIIGLDYTEYENKTTLSITFTKSDIGQQFEFYCQIVSNKDWHKYGYYDDMQHFCLCVLPAK